MVEEVEDSMLQISLAEARMKDPRYVVLAILYRYRLSLKTLDVLQLRTLKM